MKCDIVFLAHGRPEFTEACADALLRNTNWSLVSRIVVYTDGDRPTSNPGGVYLWASLYQRAHWSLEARKLGGPVNIMNHYLSHNPAPVWAKIDNDVIVPPGWLDAGLNVMGRCPELSFLGIEPPASRTRSPWGGKLLPDPEFHAMACKSSDYAGCDAIGGVGFMRTSAWNGRPPMVQHSTYGGFTDWQIRQKELVKGWIIPPLKLFVLDRLPIEPWASLSAKYEAVGEQRFWTRYDMGSRDDLWGWWEK